MRRVLVLLLIVLATAACGPEKPQPAETDSVGADRAADGTTGTGEPVPPGTDSRGAAESLGTVAPSSAGAAPIAVTGTTEVNAAQTATTSTIAATGGTTTAAVVTPTETTATVKTTTGTSVQTKKQ